MGIFLGKQGTEGWISFESDPHLTVTRSRIYTRCAPCLENLLDQLIAGRMKITLGLAYHCWKVTTVLSCLEDCYAVLDRFDELFPGQMVYGKLGGSKNYSTKAIVFHSEGVSRRDELLDMLKKTVQELTPTAPVFISRGCANPYEELLGNWKGWKQTTPVIYPERVAAMISRLRWSLYDRST